MLRTFYNKGCFWGQWLAWCRWGWWRGLALSEIIAKALLLLETKTLNFHQWPENLLHFFILTSGCEDWREYISERQMKLASAKCCCIAALRYFTNFGKQKKATDFSSFFLYACDFSLLERLARAQECVD
jgi:hypothetical protein